MQVLNYFPIPVTPLYPLERETEMATQPERIAALETSVSFIKGVVYVLVPLLVGWAAYITINVVAMKQSLADGGNAKIVAELKAPKSPAQLQANLSSVIAQVQTAQASGKKPDTEKVLKLSNAVNGVLDKNATIPEAWQATSALIGYRSQTTTDESKECSDPSGTSVMAPLIGHSTYTLTYANCTYTMDSPAGIYVAENFVKTNGADRILEFDHVRVVYRGGSVPPLGKVIFHDCSFDLQLYVPPPSLIQKMARTLLASSNIDDVNVALIS